MGFQSLILVCTLSLISLSPLLLAQQPYARRETIKCASTDNSTSVDGYSCNGPNQSCQSYLIFRSSPPYDSVANISQLFTSDPYQLSQINSVSRNATFQSNEEVIVPVNCSCSGPYYQANTSYVVKHGDTRYLIAAEIYQGLVSCREVKKQTCCSLFIYTGMNVSIPLRCACPTTNQTNKGLKYLLTYLVTSGDSVSSVSRRFGSDVLSTLDANELSEESEIYQSSTLLIPLRKKPSSNQTIITPTSPSSTPLTPPSSSDKRRTKGWAYAIIGASATAFILILFFLYLWCRKKDGATTSNTKGGAAKLEKLSDALVAGLSDVNSALKVYEFEELELATENFNEEYKISESVYHGVIMGDEVAIKEVGRDVSKEIKILKLVNHFNLIRLLGVCFHDGRSYLIYEYAKNGSLSNWIFDEERSKVFSWVLRIQIAFDVANGLSYLHSYTEPAHVHMDITSSNVLLDGDFRAKIANFGMARYSTSRQGQLALTKHIVGTRGYMAPEFLDLGLVSPKLDVYAFGVVMLEIISGKAAVITCGEGDVFLSTDFLAVMRLENAEEKLKDFMDPSLNENYPFDLAVKIAKLIERCLSRAVVSRPSMDEISQSLSEILGASVSWELSNANVSEIQVPGTGNRDM
ncbi:hypothetical protein AAC387_Pa09g1980 [Persea americana]